MPAPIHEQKIAKIYSRMIAGARPGRRRAFALGQMGHFAVLTVGKGKPATAASTLKTMSFAPGKQPKEAAGAGYKLATQGFLYLEKKVLVLQCNRRPPTDLLRRARKYFNFFRVAAPWTAMRILRLDESDEGDADDGTPVSDAEDDVAVEATTDTVEEDTIEDAWPEDAPATATLSDDALGVAAPRAADTPSTVDAHRSQTPAANADVQASAQHLTQHTLKMAHVLKLNSDDTETELRAKFEALLQKVSPERLLLALCYSGNVRDLLDVAETEPQRPIEHDDMGIADIADGVAEMGARIARERGALGAREAIDRRQIEAMVRNHWNGKQDASPAQVIVDMTALFGQTFMTVEHRRLRALLGLQGKMPPSTEQAPADSQQPGGVNDSGDKPDAIPEDLARARQGWGKARLDAVAGIGTLKAALTQEFAADDAQADLVATALKRLDELVGRLDDELDATLDAMLREADAERRLALRAAAAAKLDVMDAFVSEDELMTELDGNEILPDMKIVAPLKSGLTQVRAALS